MDNAVKHMNEAWRKAIMREARELVGHRRRHVLGCPVCFDLLLFFGESKQRKMEIDPIETDPD
jgi:hypothetical protein